MTYRSDKRSARAETIRRKRIRADKYGHPRTLRTLGKVA